jgi:chromosome segregation ATPase
LIWSGTQGAETPKLTPEPTPNPTPEQTPEPTIEPTPTPSESEGSTGTDFEKLQAQINALSASVEGQKTECDAVVDALQEDVDVQVEHRKKLEEQIAAMNDQIESLNGATRAIDAKMEENAAECRKADEAIYAKIEELGSTGDEEEEKGEVDEQCLKKEKKKCRQIKDKTERKKCMKDVESVCQA